MPFKKHTLEDITGKLHESDIVLAQCGTTSDACRRLSISEQAFPLAQGVCSPENEPGASDERQEIECVRYIKPMILGQRCGPLPRDGPACHRPADSYS